MANFKTYYVALLYLVAGLLLVTNLMAVVSGRLMALLPLSFQVAVLFAVYLRKRWSYMVVVAWSIVGMISGAAMWLAILLRGGAITQSNFDLIFRSAMLCVCLFFVVFARQALRSRSEENCESVQAETTSRGDFV